MALWEADLHNSNYWLCLIRFSLTKKIPKSCSDIILPQYQQGFQLSLTQHSALLIRVHGFIRAATELVQGLPWQLSATCFNQWQPFWSSSSDIRRSPRKHSWPIAFLNDLPDSVLSLLFVDDTKCLTSSTKDVSSHNMQLDLDALYQWSITNLMDFNQSKSTVLKLPSNGPPPVYLLNGNIIPATSLVNDLGVLISSDLSWFAHIPIIVLRAYKMLGLIRRSFSHTVSVPVRRLLYISLVCSHLTYCSVIWRPYLRKDILPNLSLMTLLWITKLGCQHSTCYVCPWPWSWMT